MKLIEKTLVCPADHTYFKGCHASTLAFAPNGDLACAFFGGEGEGKPDCAIWTAVQSNGVWQPPQRLCVKDGMPHWNPVLFNTGDELLLFFKVGPNVPLWETWLTRSPDGTVWSSPVHIPNENVLPRGPVKNKPIRLSDGRIAAPNSLEWNRVWDCFIDFSSDCVNWMAQPVPFVHAHGVSVFAGGWDNIGALWDSGVKLAREDGVIQPTLWEYPAGHIHALMRSTRGQVFRSDSADNGATWCEAYATELPNNNSGLDAVHIGGGRLALLYNPVGGNWAARTPLTLAISEDNGDSWSNVIDLETEPGEYSYPAIIYADGQLHCSYTFNRVNIVYARVEIE